MKMSSILKNFFVRIGCNMGEVFLIRDVVEKTNLWSPGISIQYIGNSMVVVSYWNYDLHSC